MINTNGGARSVTALPDGVRQRFAEAEQARMRRRAFWLLVATWIAGIGIVVWAIAKARGR